MTRQQAAICRYHNHSVKVACMPASDCFRTIARTPEGANCVLNSSAGPGRTFVVVYENLSCEGLEEGLLTRLTKEYADDV